ncbi:hypothetical protein [Streptomyces litchfieldiae]|uniref:Uncharacterized protein n=1 Tax=Streptomyces litchfieldiae TaxID=3075543 RepID=A0ABU2MN77_9ACTN|nr:hypothetical protein [Streptomyces sp. DSM 44938]MDT0342852.1 hypothetical protein [Streptomyces sp. DSM 44938]
MSGDIHFGDKVIINDGSGHIGKISYQNSASVDQQAAFHAMLLTALRTDAETAQGAEAHAARAHAEDLEEAIAAEDPTRADRIIGRVNALLAAATSAFAMTRGLLPPNG